MSKRTLQQKLAAREVHEPPTFLYRILMLVIKIMNKGLHTGFSFKCRPSEEEGPLVLISNHASRNDFLFTAPAVYPKKLNYVVGYNEFFTFPNGLLLRLMQVIPKKNFVPDVCTVRQIYKIVRGGGNICIMPEGMSSITGMAQPVIPGGAKLLKKLGAAVYYTKIAGAYLTYTKHCLDERRGLCEVTVDRMFTADELKTLSEAEIEDRMNRLLAHDDYIWNREAGVRFNGKGHMAKQLGTLLYRCPRCGALYQMEDEGNILRCRACGNSVRLDETYRLSPLTENDSCPGLVTDWTIWEREEAAREVREPGFSHAGHVKVGVLPTHRLLLRGTSLIRGEGQLCLNESGLHFDGVIKGKPFRFDISPDNLPTYGMCTDISRFYTFVNGEFTEFYPDAGDVLYWDHLTEELHRALGGKWQNTPYRHFS